MYCGFFELLDNISSVEVPERGKVVQSRAISRVSILC